VESFPRVESVLEKRLVFVTGKGGVGKTTVSGALALAAARTGLRTIVCEVAQQERLARAFGRPGGGFDEVELAERLHAISIDPQRSLEEWVRFQLPSQTLASLLNRNRMFQYLSAAAPGLRELVTIGKIWELAQLERKTPRAAPYDLVIVDAPATGHGLGMLRAPRTFRDIARVGPIRHQANKIHTFIVDPARTAVIVVALPEEMPVNETLDFRRALADELGMGLEAVVVNGVYPERFSAAEAERIAALDGRAGPAALSAAARAALSEHHRSRAQRSQLRRLRRSAGAPVATLPFMFDSELGLEQLERLSSELERRLP
jgi:anion-transporting  ArsA/GET3 family ATPase